MALNVVSIMGRIVHTPELRQTQTGTAVCNFTVAVDRAFTPKGQEKQTDFIDVVAWRGTAEFISKYFQKGGMIAINGTIQTRNYTDKQGNSRKAYEIVANNVSFCGGKAEQRQQNDDGGNVAHYESGADTDEFAEIDGSEVLPF